jgi:hypothetical protein
MGFFPADAVQRSPEYYDPGKFVGFVSPEVDDPTIIAATAMGFARARPVLRAVATRAV